MIIEIDELVGERGAGDALTFDGVRSGREVWVVSALSCPQ